MNQREAAERPVFLYDGDCAFCTSCARFIERRVPTGASVAAWQLTDLGALGVRQADAEAAVQWVPARPGDDGAKPERPNDGMVSGPEAVARLLIDAGGLWRPLGHVLGWRPVLALAWPVYRWVSRNRHRLPGGTAACSLSQAERSAPRAEGGPRR